MRPISAAPDRSPRAIAIACAGMFALAALVTACADKGLTRPEVAFNPRVALQLTIIADQQAAFGPKFLVAAAGFEAEEDEGEGGFLGYTIVPFTQGTQTLTVPVDLSKCFAYYAERGRKSCPMLVGAWLTEDTSFVTDTANGEPFENAFDVYFDGPFEIGAGGVLPRIPPLDLSASRFGVVKWAPDHALQLGGAATPGSFFSAITGVPSGAGVVLYAAAQGHDHSVAPTINQGPQGPYAQLAIFRDGFWSRVNATVIPPATQGPNANFVAVTALSTSEVYMAHPSGLYRYDGAAISKVAAISDSLFSAGSVATAGGAKLVIAGSNSGGVWIGNTQTWTRYNLSPAQRIDGVCITGPGEAFASSSTGGGLWRFDGTAWTSVPSSPSAGKFALQCPGPGQAHVIANNTALLKWNGTGWTNVPGTGLLLSSLPVWGVASASEMYAQADSAFIHRVFYKFNGTSWAEVGRTRFTQSGPGVNRTLWVDPRGGAAYYASSFGRVEKVTPSGVSVISYQPSTRDISMSSVSSAFAVGWNQMLARWDGVKWTLDAPPANVTSSPLLQGVWSDRSSNAWAVGTSSTILRYDGTSWSSVSSFASPITTPADQYNGVWGVGSDVWVVGNATILHCRSATQCSTEASGGSGALNSVWGTSATNVFAVGAGGRIARFNGTSWTSMQSPTGRNLSRVSGSGQNEVWAVGDSALIRFDGTAWHNVPMTDAISHQFGTVPNSAGSTAVFQLGLWVRSPTEVYVGGPFGGIGRWDGREWSSMINTFHRRRVVGISGLPGGCALALADGLSDNPAPTVLRGIGPSGCFLAPMVPPTSWP